MRSPGGSSAICGNASRAGTSRPPRRLTAFTWEQVRARRLARNHLLVRAPRARLVDVVRDVCGIHAQVMGAAELSIAARVADVTQADVRHELWDSRGLAKTWTIRGTLHLHPADELRLWTAARRAGDERWYESYGLTRDQGRDLLDAFARALEGGPALRADLADAVARLAGEWTREPISSGWGRVVGDAAVAGVLCHGPPRGVKVTFVRTDQWLGRQREIQPANARAEVCRRYVRSYGPATPTAFADWFGRLKSAESRELFESLRDELVEVTVEGKPAWLPSCDVEAGGALNGTVRLVPEYDSYVMGFREREQFVPERARERLRSHPRGRLEGPAAVPWLLVDGVVAGLWRRQKRGRGIEIRVEPLRTLATAERRGLEAEAERIGAFLGAAPSLSIGHLGA